MRSIARNAEIRLLEINVNNLTKKMNFIDELKEYLNSTTKEQVFKDWEKFLIKAKKKK
jgi:hypothetical protein